MSLSHCCERRSSQRHESELEQRTLRRCSWKQCIYQEATDLNQLMKVLSQFYRTIVLASATVGVGLNFKFSDWMVLAEIIL